ncbi:MAG TPA: aspartate carbamoyltransferase catalytic subunit [Firmicutes bacterium]|nr:aspartate carbamoyltransferase catalytic subunit [Bacillota bacterium]
MFPDNLLSIEDLSVPAMEEIFQRAAFYKAGDRGKIYSALKGKNIVIAFWEPSTRTRVSFELAVRRLGGSVLDLRPDHNSEKKGESLEDTLKTLEALGADALIFRHGQPGLFGKLGQLIDIPLISGGEGCYQHPTQALLDVFTLMEEEVALSGLEVVIVGDILHSRVARSHFYALPAFGARITLAGPPAFLSAELAYPNFDYTYCFDEALPRSDVLYLLRMQRERHRHLFPAASAYAALYGLNIKRLASLKRIPFVMHPGPVNLGMEMDLGALHLLEKTYPDKVLIHKQIQNGVYVRMAVLDLLISERVV